MGFSSSWGVGGWNPARTITGVAVYPLYNSDQHFPRQHAPVDPTVLTRQRMPVFAGGRLPHEAVRQLSADQPLLDRLVQHIGTWNGRFGCLSMSPPRIHPKIATASPKSIDAGLFYGKAAPKKTQAFSSLCVYRVEAWKMRFFGLPAKGRFQMKCRDAREKFSAWVDGELPEEAAAHLSRHTAACRSCAREAEMLRRLGAMLDRLPAAPAPPHLSQVTLRRFRQEIENPGLVEWWRGLGLAMRGAVCSAAIGGLVLGGGLGSSLPALQTAAAAPGLLSIVYHTGGILP
jgi:hypothetical protein